MRVWGVWISERSKGAGRGGISDPCAAPTTMMRSKGFRGPEQLESVIVVLDAVAMATLYIYIYIYIFERALCPHCILCNE